MLYRDGKLSAIWVMLGSIILILLAPVELQAGRAPAQTPPTRLLASAVDSPVASGATAPEENFLSCRLGAGAVYNPITVYDIASFRFGWYVDWSAAARSNSTLDHFPTIRTRQSRDAFGAYLASYTVSPPLNFSASGLGTLVRANPGRVWLVGNEPDRIDSQDDVLPEMYAEIYHTVYHFIKATDPTARVAIGAVVQPTPIRLAYLQRVLDAYRAKYGVRLPVDVWNTHMYIIREVKGEWGGEIPPGITAQTGRVYTLTDHLDMDIFSSLVIELRTWMKANGYQDVPLIVTEFGALMPLWFLSNVGYTQDDMNRFVRDAVNFMDSARDPQLGYAADGYRLVQQAALYSLDDDSTFPDGWPRWGTFLFQSRPPYAITPTGVYFRDEIASQFRATVDLFPYKASVTPRFTEGQPTISPGVQVLIANAGNSAPPTPVTVRFFDLTGGQRVQIGADVVLAPFTGCGTLRAASVTWPDLAPGLYNLAIEVDPNKTITESSKTNNTMVLNVRVTTHGLYLPHIWRNP